MEKNLVQITARWSTFAQILFGIASFVGFFSPKENDFLTVLLILDIVVQIIELAFYAVFVYYKQLDTEYRYIDWYITTPIQLITNTALLNFFHDETLTLESFFANSRNDLVAIVSFNFIMLSFGLMAELYSSYKNILVTIGIVPFGCTFALMYGKYAHKTSLGIGLNTYVCIVWALYSVAAYLDYDKKNVMYNILDIFSKNFYGLFLSVYLFYF